ncbi:hypothetical protein [Calidithermus timidus]|jgi:hypothetical protein|uniref:hypothetical protein n=1 Tax=Calidithermus timidus TaxID=307124 RepID=UPI0003678CAD|nr:hypothetical protein [Calidithermus timidus]
MLDKTIAAFCTIDDLLPLLGHNDDPQTKTPSSILLTLAILAALHFGGHHQKTLAFARDFALFSYLLFPIPAISYLLFPTSWPSSPFLTRLRQEGFVLKVLTFVLAHNIRLLTEKMGWVATWVATWV